MGRKNKGITRIESQKITIVAKNNIIKSRAIKNNIEKMKVKKLIKINERKVIVVKRTEIGGMKKEIKRIVINGKMYEKIRK